MNNGKISQFVKDHWLGLLSTVVVCAAVLYGIHACSVDPALNVVTKGNRIRVELTKPH